MAKPSNMVDVYVGARLRMRRMIRGMSQGKLGEFLGVTFHRLHLTARVLEVSPSYFLEGIIAPLTPRASGPS